MTRDRANRINEMADRLQKLPGDKRGAKKRDQTYVWHSNAIEREASRVSREGRPVERSSRS